MLTEEQKAEVAKWFAAGASLDEIQKRMKTEFGVHMTYLDLRLMVADLPQPVEEAPAADPTSASPSDPDRDADPTRSGPARNVPAPPRRGASSSGTSDSDTASGDDTSAAPKRYDLDAPDGTPPASDLTVEVDALTIPGTFASGTVTFSDGTKAKWYLDQQGRLGLDGVPPGYRPSPSDAALFQARLVEALRSRGLA